MGSYSLHSGECLFVRVENNWNINVKVKGSCGDGAAL